MVILRGQGQLLQVVDALGPAGGLARGLDGGQQEGDQDGDDGDDDQQLDQREAAARKARAGRDHGRRILGVRSGNKMLE